MLKQKQVSLESIAVAGAMGYIWFLLGRYVGNCGMTGLSAALTVFLALATLGIAVVFYILYVNAQFRDNSLFPPPEQRG